MESVDSFKQKANFVMRLLNALINTPAPSMLKNSPQKTSFIIHLPPNLNTIGDISFISGILDAMDIPFNFRNNFGTIIIPANFKEIMNRQQLNKNIPQYMCFDATNNGVFN